MQYYRWESHKSGVEGENCLPRHAGPSTPPSLHLVLMVLKRLDLAPRATFPVVLAVSKHGEKCFSNVFPYFSLDFRELSCRLAKDQRNSSGPALPECCAFAAGVS